MPRTGPMGGLVGAAVATLVAAGLTVSGGAAPSQARPPGPGPMIAASAASGTPAARPAPRRESWGRTYMSDKVLRRGCHRYGFGYKITTPNDRWLAQIFLVSPRGKGLGTQVVDAAYDPPKDHLSFEVCRPSTVYGVHKLKMRVTYSTYRESHTMDVKTTKVRFTRPHRRHHR